MLGPIQSRQIESDQTGDGKTASCDKLPVAINAEYSQVTVTLFRMLSFVKIHTICSFAIFLILIVKNNFIK